MRRRRTISQYTHPPTQSTAQQPATAPGRYYVSVFDPTSNAGHGRRGLLLGPFTQHADALARVEEVRAKAHEVNDRACWYAYGTVRMADDYSTPGVLNDLLGFTPTDAPAGNSCSV